MICINKGKADRMPVGDKQLLGNDVSALLTHNLPAYDYVVAMGLKISELEYFTQRRKEHGI